MKSQIENPQSPNYIGVDVSKEKLDLSSQKKVVPNTKRSINALLKRLGKTGVGKVHLVCEATGGYERLLLELAHEKGFLVSVINARQIRDFAKSSGRLAKNDQIDAHVIQHWAETFKPAPQKAPSENAVRLKALVRRRDCVVKQRTQEKVRLKKESDSWVIKDLKRSIKFLKDSVDELDSEINKLTTADQKINETRQRLEQVPGVAMVVSSTLIAELPELGELTDKEASSLAGVAPVTRQSGKWEGHSFIAGGRKRVRRALYLAAMSSRRYNPILKEFYDRLRGAGKPFKLAITAVMRKLVCLLNKMLREPEFVLK